jgi:hypothetical protein
MIYLLMRRCSSSHRGYRISPTTKGRFTPPVLQMCKNYFSCPANLLELPPHSPADMQELLPPVLQICKNYLLLSCRYARVASFCPADMQELVPPIAVLKIFSSYLLLS